MSFTQRLDFILLFNFMSEIAFKIDEILIAS